VLEISLAGLDETGVWRFLAARPQGEHVVAPPAVMQRVLASGHEPSFTYSAEIPEEHPPGGNIFVWDGERSALARARNLHPACRVFGIVWDVWCAHLVGGDVFSPSPGTSHPIVHYAVLCPPRSGSTFLCELLKQAGLGNPQEHIRPFFIELCRCGWDFEELLERVIQTGTRAGYFGTKLISHCVAELDEVGVSPDRVARVLRQTDFRIVRLLRDPAEEAVSGHFATSTGVWHQREPPRPDNPHEAVPYDPAEFQEAYRLMAAENRFAIDFGNHLAPVLDIDYRDLDRDPHGTIAAAAAFLGAPAGAVARLDLAQAPRKISRSQPRMQEYLARLRQELAQHPIAPPNPPGER
jgi:LPS sulfotransferase NodH